MKQKFFVRGWLVVFVAAMGWICTAFFGINSYSYLTTYYTGLGYNIAFINTLKTALSMVNIVLLFGIQSYLQKRDNIRRILAIGYVLIAVSYFILGRAENVIVIAVMCALVDIAAILYNGASMTLLGRWYPRKKGTMMGFVTSTTILSSLVMLPWLSAMVTSKGLPFATTVLAVVPLCVGVICLVGLKETPESCGQLPDNMPITEEERRKFTPATGKKSPWKVKDFLKSRKLVCCTLGWACIQGAYIGVSMITMLVLVSKGMTMQQVVTTVAFTGIATFAYSNISGWIDSKTNVVVAGVVTAALLAVACLVQALTTSITLAVIATYLYFFCGGAPNNLIYSHIQSLIPPRHYLSVNKYYEMFKSILLLIPKFATGWLIGGTGGNYRLIFLIYGIVFIPGIIFIVIAGHKEIPEPQWENQL